MSDPHKLFDVSPKERRVLEWRAGRRQELRNLYLKETMDPNVKHVADEAIWRFAVARNQMYFPPGMLHIPRYLIGQAGLAIFIVSSMWLITKHKRAQEREIRSGKLSYAERRKFE